MKLTHQQREMLAAVIDTGAAWTTSRNSPNHTLLSEWASAGLFEEADAPFEKLVAYRITEAGRALLSQEPSNG